MAAEKSSEKSSSILAYHTPSVHDKLEEYLHQGHLVKLHLQNNFILLLFV